MLSTDINNPPVLVIGGAGYLGSVLIRQLLKEGCRVRVFDNFSYGKAGLEGLIGDEVEIIQGDICDIRAVSRAVVGAEIVVMLAAVVGRRTHEISQSLARDVNLLASTVVLDAAIEHGVNRFIFASTDSVYGVQQGLMDESTIPDPVSLYSRLKLRVEERVINSRRKAFHPTCLRFCTCFGYSPRMRFDLIVNRIIRDAFFRQSVKIISGEQVRALIHVQDAVRSVIYCLRAHLNLVSGEIFNVGPRDDSTKIRDLADIVIELLPETHIRIIPGEPDLVDYQLNSQKIERLLDFRPELTIKESMREMIGHFAENRFANPYDEIYENTKDEL